MDVRTADELISIFNDKTGSVVETDIELLQDLDFSNAGLTLPLGAKSFDSCIPFSGTMHGNGFSLKNLIIENHNKEGYQGAGLFCGLGNASVVNLFIDSSCSFRANYVGALSVTVLGSLTVSNVTNKADVFGDVSAGGFIGSIADLKWGSKIITIEKSVNHGTVDGSTDIGGFIGTIDTNTGLSFSFLKSTNNGNLGGSSSQVGGLVGNFRLNTNTTVAISNFVNNGKVSGNQNVGGVIGLLEGNENIVLTMMGLTSNGDTTASGFSVGGIIGTIQRNTNVISSLQYCINNGYVLGHGSAVGGFVGTITNNKQEEIYFSSCANNGNVNGTNGYVAGLIGDIDLSFSLNGLSLTVINSENLGRVSSTGRSACGFFCVALNATFNVRTTVMNSINKGNVVSSTDAFGISNTVTMARSVVSIGDVNGDSGSFTFWMTSNDVDLFFSLKDRCSNCVGETLIQFNQSKRSFEVVESGQNVHDILNMESTKQQYDMTWTKDLELIAKPIVVINGLFNSYFVVEPGAQLVEIGNLSSYFGDGMHIFVSGECETRVVFDSAYVVTQSIELTLGLMASVTVGEPIKATKQMIVGETLEQASCLFSFSFDDFIVVDANKMQVLSKSTIIETNLTLRLCHHVIVSGLINLSCLIEHGIRLSEIDQFTPFFNTSFTVIDSSTNKTLQKDTVVASDIVITVMRATRVVIEIPPTNEVNKSEIIKTITDIVGVDPSIVTVDVVLDDDGKVIEIIVVVDDDNAAITIVDAINGMDTGTGCVGGVLCRKKRVYVEGETMSLSGSFVTHLSSLFIPFFFVLSLFLF